MKKNDIILGILLILVCLSISGFTYLKVYGDDAQKVIVSVNGDISAEYSIDENCEFDVNTDEGYNHIVIKDGMVSVTDSDCNGADCVAMGEISRAGERIVCLPHRLEIYIEGAGEISVDTVAY